MNIDRPIIEHHRLDVRALSAELAQQEASFWEQDQPSRTMLAGDRPGRAVYYYTEQPIFARRNPSDELRSKGCVSVLRNTSYPIFDRFDALVRAHIPPLYAACDILRVQLAELPAGQIIQAHRDDGILASVHRLHLPIQTNRDAAFIVDGEHFFLEEGMLYEVNNVAPHSARNDGASTRIHLLIDLLPHAVGRATYYDDKGAMALACLTA